MSKPVIVLGEIRDALALVLAVHPKTTTAQYYVVFWKSE